VMSEGGGLVTRERTRHWVIGGGLRTGQALIAEIMVVVLTETGMARAVVTIATDLAADVMTEMVTDPAIGIVIDLAIGMVTVVTETATVVTEMVTDLATGMVTVVTVTDPGGVTGTEADSQMSVAMTTETGGVTGEGMTETATRRTEATGLSVHLALAIGKTGMNLQEIVTEMTGVLLGTGMKTEEAEIRTERHQKKDPDLNYSLAQSPLKKLGEQRSPHQYLEELVQWTRRRGSGRLRRSSCSLRRKTGLMSAVGKTALVHTRAHLT